MRPLLFSLLLVAAGTAQAAKAPFAALPSPKAGTLIYTAPDGGKIMKLPNGDTFIRFPDGVELVKRPDGSRFYTHPNGDHIDLANNRMVLTRPDGSRATSNPDGTIEVAPRPSRATVMARQK